MASDSTQYRYQARYGETFVKRMAGTTAQQVCINERKKQGE